MSFIENFKNTKIVATLGPASSSRETLKSLIESGVNLVRCNFSHGSHADHGENIENVREIADELGMTVAICADLQGPKIRVARFREGPIVLVEGATFLLDAEMDDDAGDINAVGIDYKELPSDVNEGDNLLLNDGLIVLSVVKVDGKKIITKVVVGGKLSNHKGINRQGGGLTAEALTPKDRADLKFAAACGVDYFAISFPRDASDIKNARDLIKKEGSSAQIIAKIERVEAIENIDEIVEATDVVMMARGDLAVETGPEIVPVLQKNVLQVCKEKLVPVIIATQMMESMIDNSVPTRAEVSDVANAIFDSTDAVMLSAESASGIYPCETVEMMARICRTTETNLPNSGIDFAMLDFPISDRNQTIVLSALFAAATDENICAIVTLSESGLSPLLLSRFESRIPIFVLSKNPSLLRRVVLYRRVYPVYADFDSIESRELETKVVSLLREKELLPSGKRVALLRSDTVESYSHSSHLGILQV